MNVAHRRFCLLLALLPGIGPICAILAGEARSTKTEAHVGQVVALKDVLDRSGLKLSPEAAAKERALVTDAGKIHVLKRDNGSLMLYLDDKLLKRPMRLTGRILADGTLQVVNVHSLIKGRPHEIYYWCEICVIKRFAPGICDCCGAPLEFREEPAK